MPKVGTCTPLITVGAPVLSRRAEEIPFLETLNCTCMLRMEKLSALGKGVGISNARSSGLESAPANPVPGPLCGRGFL